MNKVIIKPFNVIEHTDLPEISFDKMPTDGDPIEINGELYFVCDTNFKQQSDSMTLGVIPLVVRDPARVLNINKYIECLSIAHRKVQFKNDNGVCELDNCTEMIIS